MSLSLARLGQPECPDDAGGGVTGGVGHPVRVEAGLGLGADDPLRLPAGEEVGRHGIAVAPAREVGLGQLDEDRVGLVAGGQVHPLGRGDDVVGRGDDLGDGRDRGPVAQSPERFEARHRAHSGTPRTGPSRGTP